MTKTEKAQLLADAASKTPALNFSASVVTDALAAKHLRKVMADLEKAKEDHRHLNRVLLDHWHSHHSGELRDCADPICTFGRTLLG